MPCLGSEREYRTKIRGKDDRSDGRCCCRLEKLSVEIEILTGKSFLPQEGWALMGQHLSVVMGNGGFRGIVMEEDSEGDGFLFKELLQELQNGDAAGSSPEEGALRDHSA